MFLTVYDATHRAQLIFPTCGGALPSARNAVTHVAGLLQCPSSNVRVEQVVGAPATTDPGLEDDEETTAAAAQVRAPWYVLRVTNYLVERAEGTYYNPAADPPFESRVWLFAADIWGNGSVYSTPVAPTLATLIYRHVHAYVDRQVFAALSATGYPVHAWEQQTAGHGSGLSALSCCRVVYHGSDRAAVASILREGAIRPSKKTKKYHPMMGPGVYVAPFVKACRFACFGATYEPRVDPAVVRCLVVCGPRHLALVPGSASDRQLPLCVCPRCRRRPRDESHTRFRRVVDHDGRWQQAYDSVEVAGGIVWDKARGKTITRRDELVLPPTGARRWRQLAVLDACTLAPMSHDHRPVAKIAEYTALKWLYV